MYGFSVLVNTFQNSKRQLAKLIFNWLTDEVPFQTLKYI